MGILDKVKNLFTEEIEEEEQPLRREVRRTEVVPPKPASYRSEPVKVEPTVPTSHHEQHKEQIKVHEVKKEEVVPVSESSVLNKEEKFKFPVYFDDKDFEDLPKKAKPKPKPVKTETAYQGANPAKVEVSSKKFKVSPVISPVYGVLDKNYSKDDIYVKPEKMSKRIRYDKELTIDDIRNKAYGTLEDDLENALFQASSPEEKPSVDTGIDIFEEMDKTTKDNSSHKDLLMHDIIFDKDKPAKDKKAKEEEASSLEEELEKQKEKINELSKYISSIQTESEKADEPLEEKKENIVEEVIKEETKPKKKGAFKPEVEDGDLFSLIDSMYEKREE